MQSAKQSFRQGWKEMLAGDTHPISQLWDDIDITDEDDEFRDFKMCLECETEFSIGQSRCPKCGSDNVRTVIFSQEFRAEFEAMFE